MDGDRGVADQRPRGRRPHQQIGLTSEWAGGHRETHVHTRVGHREVAQRDLVIRQCSATPRAVGRDAVVLNEQALVENRLERPPHALDVARVHRAVGLRHVDPVAHALRELFERVDVPFDRRPALSVELGDAVRLDVTLAGESEFLFDREFDRQAVAIPARFARNVEALHRLEPRKQVFEDAGLDVVRAGHAVGGRRAFVKRPLGATLGRGERAFENLRLAPAAQYVVFERRQVNLIRHGGEHHVSVVGLPESRRICAQIWAGHSMGASRPRRASSARSCAGDSNRTLSNPSANAVSTFLAESSTKTAWAISTSYRSASSR